MQLQCQNCHAICDFEETRFLDLTCPGCGCPINLISEVTTASNEALASTLPHDALESPSSDGALGGRLAHFELLEKVGTGGFGTVWRARDTVLGRIVALKVPRRGQLSDSEKDYFLRDARAAAQLHHANIVSVHEVGYNNDTPFIASDFVDGGNLKEWLGDRRLAVQAAAKLVAEIAAAVHHAHERGVVHRDLKPGNILMDREGRPHVADFGLAKRESGEISVTMEGQILGTPGYMSPEQARGEAHLATAASDVYSLGVILFELLTGELPFRGDKRNLIAQIQDDEPPSPRKLNSRVPRDLETICLKCLEKTTANRYGSAHDLRNDLQRYLNGETIAARPVGRIARIWRWSRRKPALAALAVLSVILAIGAPTTGVIVAYREYRLRKSGATSKEQARRAIDDYVNIVQEAELLRDPQFQPLRRRMLGEALKFYEEFILTHEHDEANRAELAEAVFQMGVINRQTGSIDVAEQAFERAIGLYRQLVAADPEALEYRSRLAASHHNAGIAKKLNGDSQAALSNYEEATELLRTLVEAEPTRLQHRRDLADNTVDLANLFSQVGQVDDAMQQYRAALEIQSVINLSPQVTDDDRRREAQAYNNLAALLREMGDRQGALQAYEKALGIFEQLAKKNPTADDYRFELAGTTANVAMVMSETGRSLDSLDFYQRAIETLWPLAEANPAIAKYQLVLATMFNNLGNCHRDLGSTSEGLSNYERARSIQERLAQLDPTVLQYQNDLALTHSNMARLKRESGQAEAALQDYRRAVEINEALVQANPAVTQFQYDLASDSTSLGYLLGLLGNRPEAIAYVTKAIQLGEESAPKNPSIPEFRRDLALQRSTLGHWQYLGGNIASAKENYQASTEILEQLAADFPETDAFQHDFAAVLTDFGNIELEVSQLEKATQHQQRASDLARRLVESNSANQNHKRLMALASCNLAKVEEKLGQSAKALTHCQESINTSRELLAIDSENVELKGLFASCLIQLATLQANAKQFDAAQASYDQAINIRRQLAEAEPRRIEFKRALADTLCARGDFRCQRGELAAAIEDSELALVAYAALRQADPEDIMLTFGQGDTYGIFGQALYKQGRDDEALGALTSSVNAVRQVVERSPQCVEPRVCLSQSYAVRGAIYRKLKQPAFATTDALARKELAEGDPDVLYEIAAELAQCAALQVANGSSPTAGGPSYDCAELAVETLRAAIDAGYRDAGSIRANSAFDTIRSDARFQSALQAAEHAALDRP